MRHTVTRPISPVILAFLMSAAALPASPQLSPQNAQEVLASTLADLRGQKEVVETSPASSVLRFSPTGGVMISTAPSPVRESAGTVSAKRLRHRPPKAARKAYEKALRKKDDAEKAVELEKAIGLDPDYAEAHNDLGVAYQHLGWYAEAAAEFRRAIALVPGEPIPRSNLAWVLSAMGQRTEAQSH